MGVFLWGGVFFFLWVGWFFLGRYLSRDKNVLATPVVQFRVLPGVVMLASTGYFTGGDVFLMGKNFLALYGGVYLVGHLEQQLRRRFHPEKYIPFPGEFTFTFVPALVGGLLLVVTSLPFGLNRVVPDGVFEIIRFYYSLYGGYYLLVHLGLFFNLPVKHLVVQFNSFFFEVNPLTSATWWHLTRAGRATVVSTALGTGGVYLYQTNETQRVKMETECRLQEARMKTEIQLKEIEYKNRLLDYKMEKARAPTWSEYLMGRPVKNSIVSLEDLTWGVKFLPGGEYLVSSPGGAFCLVVVVGVVRFLVVRVKRR